MRLLTYSSMTTNLLKIIVLRSKMIEALSSVERSIGSDSASLPVLKNVLLKAKHGEVSFIATNLETVTRHSVACKVIQDGDFTVPFSVFSGIVRNLGGERVSIERDGDALRIIADNYEASLRGISAEDFPVLPSLNTDTPLIVFPADFLKAVFLRVVVATQYSEIRPEISGVFINSRENDVVFAATDSFRLSEVTTRRDGFSKGGDAGDFSFIAPIKTVQDFQRIFIDDNEKVEVFCNGGQGQFKTVTRSVIFRLVQGVFPDYTQIIPKSFIKTAAFNKEDVQSAVRLVSSFSGKGKDIIIKSGDNGKFLEIKASQGSVGEAISKVPAKIEGGSFSLLLNWGYVLDGLKICGGKETVMGINSEDKPIKLSNPEDQTLIYVVMPIRG